MSRRLNSGSAGGGLPAAPRVMVISDQVVRISSPSRSLASWMKPPICSGLISSRSGMVTRWKVWACT
ncbi:hypothetical protein [Nonomuraea sp. NPDC049784]|uniref:hypothetical protein n=1 Tax=Nonomuraea sp. NPDC049784 TaxID=3154361 RepID=UPI00340CEEC6